MKTKTIYILEGGRFYQDGYVIGAFSTLNNLIKHIKTNHPGAKRIDSRVCFFKDHKNERWYRGSQTVFLDPVEKKTKNGRTKTKLDNPGQ